MSELSSRRHFPGPIAAAPAANQGRRGLPLPALAVVLLSGWAGIATAALNPSARVPATAFRGFNFAYETEGARSVAPTHVFDDGSRTYLQFNTLERVPEIWTDGGSGHGAARRIQVHLESPYVIVDQVLPRLRLVLDGEDSVLVNQAWSAPRVTAKVSSAPRIWTDSVPFGPTELPGPVASARLTRPIVDAVALPAHATAEKPVAAAGVAAAAGRVVGEGEATLVPVIESSAAVGTPELPDGDYATRFLDARLELLRREASVLLARALQEHDAKVELAIRKTLAAIAQAQESHVMGHAGRSGVRPPKVPPDPAPIRGPLLALADTRLRSDVGPQDESEHADPPMVPQPGGTASQAPAVHESGAVAPVERSARSMVETGSDVPLLFEVRDNQRLSQALSHFLETQGWRLEWESASDFVVRRGYTVRGKTLKQVLLEALGEFRLSAVLYAGNLVVAVSGGDR